MSTRKVIYSGIVYVEDDDRKVVYSGIVYQETSADAPVPPTDVLGFIRDTVRDNVYDSIRNIVR